MFKRLKRIDQKQKTITAEPKPQSGFQLALSALLDMLGQPSQRRTFDH